jgi:hypothetical protein
VETIVQLLHQNPRYAHCELRMMDEQRRVEMSRLINQARSQSRSMPGHSHRGAMHHKHFQTAMAFSISVVGGITAAAARWLG